MSGDSVQIGLFAASLALAFIAMLAAVAFGIMRLKSTDSDGDSSLASDCNGATKLAHFPTTRSLCGLRNENENAAATSESIAGGSTGTSVDLPSAAAAHKSATKTTGLCNNKDSMVAPMPGESSGGADGLEVVSGFVTCLQGTDESSSSQSSDDSESSHCEK